MVRSRRMTERNTSAEQPAPFNNIWLQLQACEAAVNGLRDTEERTAR